MCAFLSCTSLAFAFPTKIVLVVSVYCQKFLFLFLLKYCKNLPGNFWRDSVRLAYPEIIKTVTLSFLSMVQVSSGIVATLGTSRISL